MWIKFGGEPYHGVDLAKSFNHTKLSHLLLQKLSPSCLTLAKSGTLSKRGKRTKWETIEKRATIALSKCGAVDVWRRSAKLPKLKHDFQVAQVGQCELSNCWNGQICWQFADNLHSSNCRCAEIWQICWIYQIPGKLARRGGGNGRTWT